VLMRATGWFGRLLAQPNFSNHFKLICPVQSSLKKHSA
jgi:hypothetical protein